MSKRTTAITTNTDTPPTTSPMTRGIVSSFCVGVAVDLLLTISVVVSTKFGVEVIINSDDVVMRVNLLLLSGSMFTIVLGTRSLDPGD